LRLGQQDDLGIRIEVLSWVLAPGLLVVLPRKGEPKAKALLNERALVGLADPGAQLHIVLLQELDAGALRVFTQLEGSVLQTFRFRGVLADTLNLLLIAEQLCH